MLVGVLVPERRAYVTERQPFDPTRIRRSQPPSAVPRGEPGMLSVRQVTELIRGAIAQHLPATLHVLGEVGNLSRPASGHLYFTLKDSASELRCVMWRSAAARLKFDPEAGMEVIATGGIDVYAARGTYQLIVRKLEPRGVGALEVAFRQLKDKLEREGLFDASRKRPLPRIPERIAVVTSPTGAAIRDILKTLARRFALAEVLVYPVRVQGEGAAEEISHAIRLLNEHADVAGGIDIVIVGRGGGSLEDLWAFNEEAVARAIAASRLPIVSAVGHEVDVTIADLVADLRAPTPTAAAELTTPTVLELIEHLERQRRRAGRTASQALQLSRAGLDTVLAYDGLARPLARIRERGQLVDEMQQRLRIALHTCARRPRERLIAAEMALLRFAAGRQYAQLERAIEQRLQRVGHALGAKRVAAEHRLSRQAACVDKASAVLQARGLGEHVRQACVRAAVALETLLAHNRRLLAARLQAVRACHPRQVLRRGFTVTRDARSKRVIRSVAEIKAGMRITTEVADGEFRSTADDPKQPRLFE